MKHPRVLVVSNQCISESTSNGRTLGQLLKGWPKDRLAQFCLSAADADTSVCTNFFAVSDIDAINAFIPSPLRRRQHKPAGSKSRNTPTKTTKRRRTALTSCLRNIVWNSRRWQSPEFRQWLDSVNPQIVVMQNGDSAFMADLARHISKRYNARLVIFNTEGYCFFDHNYLRRHWSDALAFPIFRRSYRRSFMKMFRQADLSVYLNKRLDDDYQRLMPHSSAVIHNSSDMTFNPSDRLNDPPTFVYLGNLGIRRTEALAEFADVLHDMCPDCHVDVYGKLPDAYDGIFERTEGIIYHGSVSYADVRRIIAGSDFLIHVEKDDPQLNRELRYAFSTKIADSICSGRNFIVYAPAMLACSQYIAESGAAWLATNRDELRSVLKKAMADAGLRRQVIERARSVAKSNHSSTANSERFQNLLIELIND